MANVFEEGEMLVFTKKKSENRDLQFTRQAC